MGSVFLGAVGEWWRDPRRQFARRIALTTELTAGIDLLWDTDPDLAGANEVVLKEIGHHHGNLPMTSVNVAVEQPIGTPVAGGYSIIQGQAVSYAITEGYTKKYSEPGLYFRKEDGDVRLLITLEAAQNPSDFWASFHRN